MQDLVDFVNLRKVSQAEIAKNKHRCGVQGFNGMLGDICPGCEDEYERRT